MCLIAIACTSCTPESYSRRRGEPCPAYISYLQALASASTLASQDFADKSLAFLSEALGLQLGETMSPAMIPARPSEDQRRSGIPALQLRNRIKALLVDGNRFCQLAQSSFLRYYGAETQTASNGLSAYILASNSSFDLIIIDISLPVMNGLEAIRYMRARGITCKIVGMAGCWCEMHEQAILDAGADVAMEKPLFPATLVAILRELDGEL